MKKTNRSTLLGNSARHSLGFLTSRCHWQKKFTYDVWGDAVNIASRMEASSMPGAINISQATFELIKDFFDCKYRGKIAAKNKGNIDMYFVTGIKQNLALDPLSLLPNDDFNALYSAQKLGLIA